MEAAALWSSTGERLGQFTVTVCEQDCKAFKAGQKLESRMLFWLVRNLINMVTNGRLGGNKSKTPGGTTPCNEIHGKFQIKIHFCLI